MRSIQARVGAWLLRCFGSDIAHNREERCDRFVEEAIELVQACGYDKARIHALIDYVYSRPPGELAQEVGGVVVSLAAHCEVFGISMEDAAAVECERIEDPEVMLAIRQKQEKKPTGSALPVSAPDSN